MEKKILLIFLLLGIILLSGCTRSPNPYICPDGTEVMEPRFCEGYGLEEPLINYQENIIEYEDVKGPIAAIRCPEIRSGQGLIVYTDIIVKSPGSFFTSVTCGESKQINSNLTPMQIGSGTLMSKIGGMGYIGTITCTSKLYNSMGSYQGSGTVTCNVTEPAHCAEGEWQSSGECRQECISGIWKDDFCCNEGYELKFNSQTEKYYCN